MIKDYFHIPVYIWIAIAIFLFPVLLKIPAPYGRHNRKGWGPALPNRPGWIIMEIPALIVFASVFLSGTGEISGITWIFLILWGVHYTNRSIIYPLRIKTKEKKIPVLIVLCAFSFNIINGFINGFYFSSIRPVYDTTWLTDPRFIAGFVVFLTGMYLNIRSDEKLLSLRNHSSQVYSIPSGGMFRYVSCPNFLGEIIEWTGFAIMSWSPAALAFLIWTFVNLIPRSLDHHRWYKNKFEDYPLKRKAVIPFIL